MPVVPMEKQNDNNNVHTKTSPVTPNYVEKERDLLRDEVEHLKKQISLKESEEKSMDDYLREMKLFGDLPKDQFSHQYKLWAHPSIKVTRESSRGDLFNPDLILGNIEDSKTLYFLQRDYNILQRLFDMGLRSDGVWDLFENLYYPWLGGVNLTRALKGKERDHQSFIEPVPHIDQAFTYLEKRKMKKEMKGRKKLLSYLQPGDQGGGGIYNE